jgi:uncharacterized protein YjfI (DUF2170 family)
MIFEEDMLIELKNILFGVNNNIEIDLENKIVNYNEFGDLYYVINTYSNETIKSILVCAKVDDISAYREIFLKEDDISFLNLIDRVILESDNTEEIINRKFNEKARKARDI